MGTSAYPPFTNWWQVDDTLAQSAAADAKAAWKRSEHTCTCGGVTFCSAKQSPFRSAKQSPSCPQCPRFCGVTFFSAKQGPTCPQCARFCGFTFFSAKQGPTCPQCPAFCGDTFFCAEQGSACPR